MNSRMFLFSGTASLPFAIAIVTQLLFTAGDLLARYNMRGGGFTVQNFISWWFLAYFTIRQFAMFGQLYVFVHLQLGKSMALFGAVSILLSNMFGFLLLGEVLSPGAYVGVSLAVMAFLALALL